MNTVQVLPENKWFKADDQRFKPGNILLAARNMSTIFIIDRQTGEVVWQYSGDYKGGLSGVHEPQMIQPGLPGAGNILIFDNGRKKHVGQSFVLEIEPVNRGLVWKYDVGATFFSRIAGSQQRLPNGNTLISEDDQGRVFEVTPKGEIVWEYLGHHRSSRARRYPGDYLL